MKFHKEINIAAKIDSLETCRKLLEMRTELLYVWRYIECRKLKEGDKVLYLPRLYKRRPKLGTIIKVNQVTVQLSRDTIRYSSYNDKCDPDDLIKVTDKNRKILSSFMKEECRRKWIVQRLKEAGLWEG